MRLSIFSILFAIIFSTQFLSQSFNSNELAFVGDQIIYTDDFKARYSDYLFETGIKDNLAVRQAMLNGIISELLLSHYDDNSKILANDEYVKEINWVSKQSPLAHLKDQEIYAKITVSDEELRNAFIRVNENLSASHLYAQTLEEAEYLYDLVQMGVDWDNLAAKFFLIVLYEIMAVILGILLLEIWIQHLKRPLTILKLEKFLSRLGQKPDIV